MISVEKHLEEYAKVGYTVVDNVLAAEELAVINRVIDNDLLKRSPFWMEREHGNVVLNVHMLLIYQELDITMHTPKIMPIIESILGPEACAEEHSVRIRKAFDGDPYCNWHRDGQGWPQHKSSSPYFTNYISVAYYLSDVNNSTHSFSVLPGSIRDGKLSDISEYDKKNAHHIVGEKGTAIIFNAAIFHGGNVRKTDTERRTIHTYWGRSSNPPVSNYTIFPQRLWGNKNVRAQRYYRRLNPITKLLRESFYDDNEG